MRAPVPSVGLSLGGAQGLVHAERAPRVTSFSLPTYRARAISPTLLSPTFPSKKFLKKFALGSARPPLSCANFLYAMIDQHRPQKAAGMGRVFPLAPAAPKEKSERGKEVRSPNPKDTPPQQRASAL